MIETSRIKERLALVSGLIKARIPVFVTIGAAAVATAVVGAALVTPGSGVVSAPVVARASFADSTDLKFKVTTGQGQQVILAPDARETVMQQIIIAPGGHTGWHSHPGPVVVLVKSGALTFYAGDDPTCTGRTYAAGQAFVDSGQGHVHIARNEGGENLELWATYFDVPPGGAFRINAASPGYCGF
ncbi:MAG: cupin domain-containing protein [Acidobacteriota bacterium]